MDISALITQLPNFAGLLIALAYMWRVSTKQQELIEKLINTIVTRENCPETEEQEPVN